MNKFLTFFILSLISYKVVSMQETSKLNCGIQYYNLEKLNDPPRLWCSDDELSDQYAMNAEEFSNEQIRRLSRLGFIISTRNGPGNLYIRPARDNYKTLNINYFEFSEEVADAFQKVSQLMDSAKADFTKTAKFLYDPDIRIGEKQKYIYASIEDKNNIKIKSIINLKNYETINQNMIKIRVNNLVSLATSFGFAKEKVNQVFPGLVEAYLAYEYIYGIFEEQMAKINAPLDNPKPLLAIKMLSTEEKAILLGSLARAVDLLQPLAQRFLLSVGENNIVLGLCEHLLKKYDFYQEEEEEEEIIETLAPLIEEIIEAKEEIAEEIDLKVEVVKEPVVVIKKVHPKKSKQEKRAARRARLEMLVDVKKEKCEKIISNSSKKIITCLSKAYCNEIISQLSASNREDFASLFDHKRNNLVFTTKDVSLIAGAIADLIKGQHPTIAKGFYRQLNKHLHPAHNASDSGNKLKSDYIDKLRPFFIMVGFFPEAWTPKTANDLDALQKYSLRLLEAQKRNQL